MELSSSDWLLGAFFEPKGAHTAGALLEACAQRLLAAGVRVGGLVQHTGSYASGGKRLELVDVASGERFEISQNLGAASSGCCINEQAMAHASGAMVIWPPLPWPFTIDMRYGAQPGSSRIASR